MDWNWFYSTISQSTAALVGVFGAFLISYLISLRQNYKTTKRDIGEFNRIIEKKWEEIKSKEKNFDWYNKIMSAEYLNLIGNQIFNGADVKSEVEYYNVEKFSKFESKFESIKRINDEVRKVLEMKERRENGGGGRSIYPSFKSVTTDQQRKFKEEIIEIFREFKFKLKPEEELQSRIDDVKYTNKLIKRSIWVMVLLFVVGIIYPISLLPVKNGTDYHFSDLTLNPFSSGVHWWILTFVSLIVFGALAYLYSLVKNIEFDKDLIDEFNKKRDPTKQPIWYQNYLANTKDQEK